MEPISNLPVAVIGAGPVGLAAAAHLARRQQAFTIIEGGSTVGAAMRQWGHVTLFSPWRYCIDAAARQLLEESGWQAPDEDALPTGDELVDTYLAPLAAHPAIAPYLSLNSRVLSIGRQGIDKSVSADRASHAFELHLSNGKTIRARAVLDASGTWSQPNPLGADGHPAHGELASADAITYGIPDVTGDVRSLYAGSRVLVVGSGHSAINSVLALLDLKNEAPGTSITWAMRRRGLERVYGGESSDGLPARGALGSRARQAVESGAVEVLSPFHTQRVQRQDNKLMVSGELDGATYSMAVDRVVVATGFRPNLEMLREMRLSLDPALESSLTLGPLIDPNVHSCGTVPPHGVKELAHVEPDFFAIGSKSYGRAPTFLMATGYEQARSVVAHLAGDYEAAARVELVLPETGVCGSSSLEGACCPSTPAAVGDLLTLTEVGSPRGGVAGCCGGPAAEGSDACCVLDAEAKAAGQSGCGCGTHDHDHVPSIIAASALARDK